MHRTVVALVLALTLTAGACSSDKAEPATSPPAMAAKQLVDDMAAGNFSAVTSNFDAEMTKNLSGTQLATSWQAFQQNFGTYVSRGEPKEVKRGTITIEQVPVKLSKNKGEVRVSYHPDLKIAGLYFLKAGEPLPP